MEKKTENEKNPLKTSEEIRKEAREELNRQLQGLLNDKPIENLADDNIEDQVKRLTILVFFSIKAILNNKKL